MALLYTFSARTVVKPDRLFRDKDALMAKIQPRQRQTGHAELVAFMAALYAKKGSILAALAPLSHGAIHQAAGLALGVPAVSGQQNAAQRLLYRTVVIPQIKLYSHCNNTLGVYEEQAGRLSGAYRLELRIDTLTSSGTLATSDDAPKDRLLAFRPPAQDAADDSDSGTLTMASAL